ncbi:hypothetical protein [Streptomyces collinus]|uniref:hypothetical protein n=1 Tax=Streptomyces collinus TaxID=42684 RepID=UPI00368661A1
MRRLLVAAAGSAWFLRRLRQRSITVVMNYRKRPVARRQVMSEASDKKAAFNDAQEVYYNEISRYASDVFDRFRAINEADVPAVLEVIHLEWLERLENAT